MNKAAPNDYNSMVDEILLLKSKEVNLKKRTYKRRAKKAAEATSKAQNFDTKELDFNLTSIEEFSETEMNKLTKSTSLESKETSVETTRYVTEGNLGVINVEKAFSDTFKENFWPKDDLFDQSPGELDISTSSPFSLGQAQLENVWSAPTCGF